MIRLCVQYVELQVCICPPKLTSQPVNLVYTKYLNCFLPLVSKFWNCLIFSVAFSTCSLTECPEVREDREDNEASSWQRLGRRSHPKAEFTFFISIHGHISRSSFPPSNPLSSFGIWSIKSFLGELICSWLGIRPGCCSTSHYVLLFSSI